MSKRILGSPSTPIPHIPRRLPMGYEPCALLGLRGRLRVCKSNFLQHSSIHRLFRGAPLFGDAAPLTHQNNQLPGVAYIPSIKLWIQQGSITTGIRSNLHFWPRQDKTRKARLRIPTTSRCSLSGWLPYSCSELYVAFLSSRRSCQALCAKHGRSMARFNVVTLCPTGPY